MTEQIESGEENRQDVQTLDPVLRLFPDSNVKRIVKQGAPWRTSKKLNGLQKTSKGKVGASGNVLWTKDALTATNAASCVFINYVMTL